MQTCGTNPLCPAVPAAKSDAHSPILGTLQIDEGSFYLIEQGPACRYIQLQDCEVLQGRCGTRAKRARAG